MRDGKEVEIKSALEQLIIQNNVLSESSFEDFFDGFDDDDDDCDESNGFLTKTQEKIIESLCRLPAHRWDSKKLCKGYLILEEYKEELVNANIQFNLIKKPDFTRYELSKNSDLIKVGKNNSIIINKEICNDFENIIHECPKTVHFQINLRNIVHLWNLQTKEKLIISSKVLNIINLYINNVNHEKESCLLEFPNYQKEPMPFQHTGILFGLLNKKILIADEMGLGKTIQALGILSNSGSLPAIIVCPKSLKYKWANECSFLDNAKIEIVDNKTDFTNIDKDIYIINYENVRKYIDILESKKEIKAVVFDECHYLKNPKTKRSKSCQKLVNYKEYVIELSGSPVLNRPSELINQIAIIDRLEEFGGYQNFTEKYCINEKEVRLRKYKNRDNFDDSLIEYDESPNYEELAEKLRSSFYIRREKKEILKDLPPKFRTIIPVEINNKQEYKKLFKEYKSEKDLKTKKRLLETLKETACKGKFDSIVERIDSHIENKEKVVVFAYHKKMQAALIEAFPTALKIVSEQSEFERNRNAEQFQDEDSQYVIICSISIANCGFDLFSSSQVLFTQMDWVPLINIQCEDRTHRIGQVDSVNVWYMVAKDTIEEQIVKINKEKMETIDKINQKIEFPDTNIKDLVMKLIEE
jgi:SWI/SNF-related matrix-associated actin-dependent regulator 1 of chromatin subfamily A